MWQVQRPSGEWNWLKCDWPPLEHDDYYGAVLAAVAVGYAPERYAATPQAQQGVARLRQYVQKTPPPDLHHAACCSGLPPASTVCSLLSDANVSSLT